MNWQKKLYSIEILFGEHTDQDWTWVIDEVEPLLEKYPDEVNVWIRCLYIFHNILVEEGCTVDTAKQVVSYFQLVFRESQVKFSDSSKYLFFVGKIMYIAEWYWGLDYDDDELALQFQRKACEIDPKNKLYAWGFLLSLGDAKADCLAKKILSDKTYRRELLDMGYAGEYVLDHLEQSAIRCSVSVFLPK